MHISKSESPSSPATSTAAPPRPGIDAEPVGARTGVTSWVDAGSAGAFTLDGLRRYVIEPAKVRIAAFLNISCSGLVAWDCELLTSAPDKQFMDSASVPVHKS
jgi:predicted amidohydrolase